MTQAEKKRAVVRRLGRLPRHVEFVPIDFSTHTLDAMLPAAGFRAAARTFFICEGVTHYLSASDVDTLFRYVARSADAGSEMVFTYIHRTILDGTATFAGAGKTLAIVRRSGEPYTFGFDPAELPQYLAARDLELIEDVGASTYRERYLDPLGRARAAVGISAGRARDDCRVDQRLEEGLGAIGVLAELRDAVRAAVRERAARRGPLG